MKIRFRQTVILATILLLPFAAAAQKAGGKTVVKKPTPTANPAATPQPTPEPVTAAPVKRNERPTDTEAAAVKANSRDTAKGNEAAITGSTVYTYEFDRPGFTYSPIRIEHDDSGKGKITFKHDGADESITDPLSFSPVTIANIKAAFTALKFIDSDENYQYPKDFSNMGNVTVMLRSGGRSRTAKFNWTENKDAKALYDEYRRIGNEYIWKFEITIGRENQPLQTPALMDEMDSYLKRNEISDPPHLVPLLTELSTDERLPLIARNRAAKMVKQVEKVKK